MAVLMLGFALTYLASCPICRVFSGYPYDERSFVSCPCQPCQLRILWLGEEEGDAHDLWLSRSGQGTMAVGAMTCVMLPVVGAHASLTTPLL